MLLGTQWTIPAELNHLLLTELAGFDRANLNGRIKTCEALSLIKRPSLTNFTSLYHKMLLSQPPAKEVEFELYFYSKRTGKGKFHYHGDGAIRAAVANPAGVTLGDVVREVTTRLGPSFADYGIKPGPSRLFLGGVVFPTEAEVAMVRRNGT